jgi:hypothetical protein
MPSTTTVMALSTRAETRSAGPTIRATTRSARAWRAVARYPIRPRATTATPAPRATSALMDRVMELHSTAIRAMTETSARRTILAVIFRAVERRLSATRAAITTSVRLTTIVRMDGVTGVRRSNATIAIPAMDSSIAPGTRGAPPGRHLYAMTETSVRMIHAIPRPAASPPLTRRRATTGILAQRMTCAGAVSVEEPR